MSLKYRDVTGKETPIAGLNGLSGELVPSVSYYQSGTKSLTQSTTQFNTATIALTDAMPDNDYCVDVSVTGNNLLGVVQFPTVISRTTSAFTVAWINDTSKATASDTLQITWKAFKLMTDESRAIDEAAIAQNASDIATLKTFGKKVLWTGSVTRGGTISLDSTGYDELYAICGGTKLRCITTGRGTNIKYKFTGTWSGRDSVQEGALVGYYKQDYILDILANGTVATCAWFSDVGTSTDDGAYHGQYMSENNINCTQIIGVKYPTIA